MFYLGGEKKGLKQGKHRKWERVKKYLWWILEKNGRWLKPKKLNKEREKVTQDQEVVNKENAIN